MKLFELFATLGLQTDDFEKGAKSAIKQGSSFASSISSNFTAISAKAVALGNAMYDIGKQIVRMSGDAVKSVITEYAETEQLVGGVETLFKDSSDRLIELADNAFMTAGLSANEYMEQAVSFSATLLQGLGGDTEAAVTYADMAMKDMSDNANKFGTDISMIQNAYQGFAKDNYTMLDNLKLGYGGTQEEMARLVNESGVLGDAISVTAETVKDVPFDKIIDAIHVIQERIGVAGTTAEEAANTVSGSIASFGAAWSNFVSGIASDDKEMGRLIDNLFVTGENVVRNVTALIPRIWDNAIESVNNLLDRWDVTSQLKKAFNEDGLRGLWNEATKIAEDALNQWGPLAFDAGSDILSQVLTALTGDTVSAEGIKQTLSELWTAGSENVTALAEAGKNLLSTIYEGMTGQEATATNIMETIGGVFSVGYDEALNVINTATTFFDDISKALGDPDANLLEKVGGVFNAGRTAMTSLLDDASGFFSSLYEKLTNDGEGAKKVKQVVEGLFSVPQTILNPEGMLLPEYQGSDARNDIWEYDYRAMAQTMRASPYEYGITESIAEDWLATLMRYDSGALYEDTIRDIIAAYESIEANDESDDEAENKMSESADELSQAAKDMKSAAEKMASMSITFDTGAVIGVVSAGLSRNARSSKYTAVSV